jgi:hypothetical protein
MLFYFLPTKSLLQNLPYFLSEKQSMLDGKNRTIFSHCPHKGDQSS